MGRVITWVVLLAILGACGTPLGSADTRSPGPGPDGPSPSGATHAPGSTAPVITTPSASPSPSPVPTASPSAAPAPTPVPRAGEAAVRALIDRIDPFRMDDHLRALVAAGSRDPRHPGHARAVAYLYEQLRAIPGISVQTHRTAYQGIPLENIFAVLDPPGYARETGWVMVSAHYDSISNRTPGWDPRTTPAPGADDNATGVAALLELARILAPQRALLRERLVLAFFDGEELFYKGSAAYVSTLPRGRYKAAINLDMVGFNPLADRLDLLWYLPHSARLRDLALDVNRRYAIGVTPLVAQYAADGSTIMDAAPFGLAGIPSIALCQRYGENDATFPGNHTFHTRNDTEDKVTNRRLWLKAARLTLALALEVATEG
ncbi:MAG TPA: M28 family peptidase [Candidatus Limnocylindria bacterium]|nr:M28 family peptidase [Candidatus Limnocylindria bacterium]